MDGVGQVEDMPPQYTEQPIYDFRNMAQGPRGYKCSNKRKLEEYEEQAEKDESRTAMIEGGSTDPKPQPKRAKKNNIVGVGFASGKPWKAAAERAGSLRNPILSSSWDKKMKLKREKDAFKTAKKEAIAAYKGKVAKIKEQREKAKAKKEENKKKSNVTQAITSNATLRKMMKSKKQRKLLQKADTLK